MRSELDAARFSIRRPVQLREVRLESDLPTAAGRHAVCVERPDLSPCASERLRVAVGLLLVELGDEARERPV